MNILWRPAWDWAETCQEAFLQSLQGLNRPQPIKTIHAYVRGGKLERANPTRVEVDGFIRLRNDTCIVFYQKEETNGGYIEGVRVYLTTYLGGLPPHLAFVVKSREEVIELWHNKVSKVPEEVDPEDLERILEILGRARRAAGVGIRK